MTGLASRLGADVRLGTFVKLPAIETVELMKLAGLDLVTIDLEHAPLSIETAAQMLAIARARGLATLVRIPSHGYEWVQRTLDAGGDGVLVPHVDTPEQARAVVTAARFPGGGTRGMGPTTRAGDWGLSPMPEYQAAGNQTAVVAQIESRLAVDNVEAIVAAGVSALFIGPVDLACEMGVAADSEELGEARTRVLAASRDAGIPCGIAAGTGAAGKKLLDEGFSFVLVGNDCTMLGSAARAVAAEFHSA